MKTTAKKTILMLVMITILSNFVLADYVKVISINIPDSGTMFATDLTETLRIYKDGRWAKTPVSVAGVVYTPCYWTAYPATSNQQGSQPARGFWSCGGGGNKRIGYSHNDFSADNNYDYMKKWNPYPLYNELNYNPANWKITCTEQYGYNLGESNGWIYSPPQNYPLYPGSVYPDPFIYSPCFRIQVGLVSATREYVDFFIMDRGQAYPGGGYCQDFDCWGRSIGGLEIGYERVCTLKHHLGCVGNQSRWFDSCNNSYQLLETCSGTCQASGCCNANSYSACYNGDRYWYDSCDNLGAMREDCGDTCQADSCISYDVSCTDCVSAGYRFDGACDASFTWETGLGQSCCGDDTGEFYDGAGSCDGTHACCDSASDVVREGKCALSCSSWENLNGEEITSADLGDTVNMVLRKSSLSEGNAIQFEIYEGSDSIRAGADAVTGKVDAGIATTPWTIIQEDLDKTTNLNNFYFTTDFSGDISDPLSISEIYNNNPTNVQITFPRCGAYFNAGSNIVNIIVNATDNDDIIEGTLNVEGSQIATFDNKGVTAGYTFSTGGNYKIIVETINNRGQKSRRISNVMVIDTTVDGEYVAACITKPEDYSNIPTSYVEFDASDSLGIRYNATTGITTEINPSGLNFNWAFSDGRTNPNNLGTTELSYQFFKNFHAVGSNWATLQVSII